MRFKDQIDFVRQHIKKNKLRVFMTVLAATMGTAFLIVLASVGFGIHDTIRSEVLSDRKVTEIEVYSSEMTKEQINEMKKIDHVNAVVNRQQLAFQTEIHHEEWEAHTNLLVTDFAEEAKVGMKLSEGRLPQNEKEVVIGSHFKDVLYVLEDEEEEPIVFSGDLIGKEITMNIYDLEGNKLEDVQQTYTIVGITAPPARDWMMDEKLYLSESNMALFEKILRENTEDFDAMVAENPISYSGVHVYASSLEYVKQISQQLKDKDYYVYSVTEELEQLDVFFFALKAGLIFVGTIAILISSIGIFNTMTMAVTERTREIGVMKAIGANPKLIQRLFLMESAWIGAIGTIIAIIISYGVSIIANYLLPIIIAAALDEENFADLNITFSIIPWQLVVIASVISISVAMISGWRPARKATRIDVIGALRQEL